MVITTPRVLCMRSVASDHTWCGVDQDVTPRLTCVRAHSYDVKHHPSVRGVATLSTYACLLHTHGHGQQIMSLMSRR
jgi:hypothetical protein